MSDDDLREKIKAAIRQATDDGANTTEDYADAVLPIVRAAQKRAWDEGQESGWANAREESDQHGGVCDMWKPHVWLDPNPYREEQNR